MKKQNGRHPINFPNGYVSALLIPIALLSHKLQNASLDEIFLFVRVSKVDKTEYGPKSL